MKLKKKMILLIQCLILELFTYSFLWVEYQKSLFQALFQNTNLRLAQNFDVTTNYSAILSEFFDAKQTLRSVNIS
jgi:hypothetical protein